MDSRSIISITSTSSSVYGSETSKNVRENTLAIESIPSTTEKVQSWMKNCNLNNGQPSNNSSICIRYDFDKTPKSKPYCPKNSSYTEITPLSSYIEEVKKIASKQERPNGNHLKNGNPESPLSPESHKKELCNYLQLMKPTDKQTNFLLEFRRSGRLKTTENSKYPTLKSLQDLNIKIPSFREILKRKMNIKENPLMPLPPKKCYTEIMNFEDCIKPLIKEAQIKRKNNKRKFRFANKFSVKFRTSRRVKTLRSRGYLKNISLDKLILRKNHLRRKKIFKKKVEIVPVSVKDEDDNIDLRNFVDDMLELDKMSEEHRKSVIESRILASEALTNLVNIKGVEKPDVQKAFKIFSELKKPEERVDTPQAEKIVFDDTETSSINVLCDHDYVKADRSEDEEESVESDLDAVPLPDTPLVPVAKNLEMKTLHQSLTQTTKRRLFFSWNSNSNLNRKINHPIRISKGDGKIHRIFYQDYNLVIAQQNLVSFWTQSALGNVLGAQNMWVPKGQIQRITLNSTYTQKSAIDMVLTTETSIAFVELWTKEHKSDVREIPIADVFAIVYFWRLRQNGLEKKALQLENIKGFASEVEYCVLKSYPRIIVSWHSVQGLDRKTKIHLYHLAADFQTVANINEIQPVDHHVSSLHNIEDCDSLIMGCGDNKVTIWNVEYRYIVATIEMLDIKSPLSTCWIKCDRGFLFTIQECVDQLRLIAINGIDHSWKKLQNYKPSPEFKNLKGAYIENGLLIAYYNEGILCWNAQTGELILEEIPNECEYIPSGKFVIIVDNENIIVRHSLSYLVNN